MTSPITPACAHRPLSPKECCVFDAGLDQFELHLLQVARWFFVSFAQPPSHAWLRGFGEADAVFGSCDGPRFAYETLGMVQALRHSRLSVFHYSNPSCESCALVLTEAERRLFQSLSLVRRGRIGRAQAGLMMLCEGNETTVLQDALKRLAIALPKPLAVPKRPVDAAQIGRPI